MSLLFVLCLLLFVKEWPKATSTFDCLVWDPAITDLDLTVIDWDQFLDHDVIGELLRHRARSKYVFFSIVLKFKTFFSITFIDLIYQEPAL